MTMITENEKDSGDTEGEPVAYAFELRGKDASAEWGEVVDFKHPEETYLSYGGFEVRNIRPLYTDNSHNP